MFWIKYLFHFLSIPFATSFSPSSPISFSLAFISCPLHRSLPLCLLLHYLPHLFYFDCFTFNSLSLPISTSPSFLILLCPLYIIYHLASYIALLQSLHFRFSSIYKCESCILSILLYKGHLLVPSVYGCSFFKSLMRSICCFL